MFVVVPGLGIRFLFDVICDFVTLPMRRRRPAPTPPPHVPPTAHTSVDTMRRTALPCFLLAALGSSRHGAFAWTSGDLSAHVNFRLRRLSLSALSALSATNDTPPLARHALLISSFSDGVVESPPAKAFLKLGLAKALTSERSRKVEGQVRESVLFSPCAGPSIDLLNTLEDMDNAIASLSPPGDEESATPMDASEMERRANEILSMLSKAAASSDKDDEYCRILYVPTAMYALNPESKNTPGKQRQRARADGKKRRNLVVKTIEDLLGEQFAVLACTLDFDDGSIKQPVGSDDGSLFPKDGKEALSSWKPHLIYVEGGNTFWLQHCIERGDWVDDIMRACTGNDASAVYVGKSAGAIIAGSRVDTATWKGWDNPAVVPGKEAYGDWYGHKGMSFAGPDISIFPHMEETTWKVLVQEKTKQMMKEDGNGVNVYSLHEWEACCIDGDSEKVFVVSGEQ